MNSIIFIIAIAVVAYLFHALVHAENI
ncbi:potassium-transporting ATPase subunit F [Salipaludibacillus agaradhaerens]|uniref:Potassium-transporting ATPase subunit F n=1 Tax=Salipaludibacillus agaradhaerens TaxID=76935 RepID=A0A9Q4FYV7_SALAG|nr:potassium-transporting ATPase subunit F [Salipaludibacillus agaradhaerens]MCR6114302.1 potassium-transporting ATPase subunit F [Salipaludibacillus agaradhaerens]